MHALDGLFSVLQYYLGCMVVNKSALFAEWSITERDVIIFRYFSFGFFLEVDVVCDGHFPGFGKCIKDIFSTSDLHCFGSVCWLYWGLLFT